MECTIDWGGPDGMLFIARTGSGHVAAMDGAPEGGGHNLAPRPMEMLLAGTGGCAAYDVVLILKRGRHKVTNCQVKLSAERADRSKSLHPHTLRICRERPGPAPGRRRTRRTVVS